MKNLLLLFPFLLIISCNSEFKDRSQAKNEVNKKGLRNGRWVDFFDDDTLLPSKNRILSTDFFNESGRNGPGPFNGDGSTKRFGQSYLQDVYLGGYFIQTILDNEDPTILGVDIMLKS